MPLSFTPTRIIFFNGKGGVGKTSLACATAVALADAGRRVLLVSTDPASNLDEVLGVALSGVPSAVPGAAGLYALNINPDAAALTTTDPAAHVLDAMAAATPGVCVTRIDPSSEVARYAADVMATSGAGLDEQGRALLEEDLRSPCTEEIAVFRAFARIVEEGMRGFVVIDTAPTGHTLLLLDAAKAYHREVERTHGDAPEGVRHLLPRLRDPGFTRILLVTVPEATPVHEAAALQEDLRRAGIEPFAWVVNQSFAAAATEDPVLVARGRREEAFIEEVRTSLARRMALVAWQTEPPRGAAALRSLAHAPVRATRPEASRRAAVLQA